MHPGVSRWAFVNLVCRFGGVGGGQPLQDLGLVHRHCDFPFGAVAAAPLPKRLYPVSARAAFSGRGPDEIEEDEVSDSESDLEAAVEPVEAVRFFLDCIETVSAGVVGLDFSAAPSTAEARATDSLS